MRIKLITALFIAMGSFILAGDYETEAIKYKSEKIFDESIYFPKKTPEYIESLLNYDNPESYYELARIYFILEKTQIADKYFAEYEKKGSNYLNMALYCINSGNKEKAENFLKEYIKRSNVENMTKNYDIIKKMVEKKGIGIELSALGLSKKDILFIKDRDEEFIKYFYENSWSETEKASMIGYLSAKNLDKSPKLKDFFFSIADKESIKRYYFNNIESASDVAGYNAYYKICEALGFKIEIKNSIEKLMYYKYKGMETEYNESIKFEKDEAEKEMDIERLYILYKLDGEKDFKIIYNLSFINEKFSNRLIDAVKNDKFSLTPEKKEEMLLSLANSYINVYPSGAMIDICYKIKIEAIKDNLEKIKAIEEAIVKRPSSIELLALKLNCLNQSLMYIDAESNAKLFLDKNYPNKKIIDEYIFSMEKQNKINDLIAVLEMLSDKSYYYDYTRKSKIQTTIIDKDKLIDYYIANKNYDLLINFKNDINYEQYKKLIYSGRAEFKRYGLDKYPFETEWAQDNSLSVLFFNQNFSKYDEMRVNIIINKIDKTDMEKYYLAKYYYSTKNYNKCNEILADLTKKYRLNEILVKLYIDSLKKAGDRIAEEIYSKNKILLEWE